MNGRQIFWNGDPPPALAAQAWGVEVRFQLPSGIDLANTFITDEQGDVKLPDSVRYLRTNWSKTRLPEGLLFLSLSRDIPDAAEVPRSLRGLGLHGSTLQHPEALASLGELRFLSLAGCLSFDDTRLVAGLLRLRSLELDGTSVSDLSPLARSSQLESVTADMTPLATLPLGSVPWRRLWATDARLSPQTVASFQLRNPSCQVLGSWEAPLEELESATRLEVHEGGRTLARIDEPGAIRDLLRGLHFRGHLEEWRSYARGGSVPGEREAWVQGFECTCEGGPALLFFCGDRLLAELNNQHGQGLRWDGSPWPGDAPLTKEAARFYTGWLARHGVPGPQAELRRSSRSR